MSKLGTPERVVEISISGLPSFSRILGKPE